MAGLVNQNGDVHFLQMRPSVKSLAPEDENRAFVQLNALLIFGACERLSNWGGAVESATVRYDKVIMYLARFNEEVLVVTVEKDEALETIPEIIRSVRSLKQKLAE
jgi:hypothetical protein